MKDTENTSTGAGFKMTNQEAARIIAYERDGIPSDLDADDTIEAFNFAIARLGGELFTLEELKSWLYANAMNNIGNGYGGFVEEIINRLDGFQRFVADRRGDTRVEPECEHERRLRELSQEAWDDQMRQDAIEAQAAQDEEPGLICGGNDFFGGDD